ncbi:hypothetical protein SAMN04487928_14614 [Butyrivibrio proteoclasticus]|uniref:Uncharacterized protein n=1 Tax=Butyrivibrio proteoclasticus TaxID=43305 RepID=A0A1I5YI26_9FIRM|nr:hypothetical protein [Butyrivibrio proteoclasticus]SFQ43537.1 hypothetical protein SAMN04487928_14614 [Butyrivibrio proteoclasticus]
MRKNCLLYKFAIKVVGTAIALSLIVNPYDCFAKENAVSIESTVDSNKDDIEEILKDSTDNSNKNDTEEIVEDNKEESTLQATYSYVVGDQNFKREKNEEENSMDEIQVISDEEVARNATYDEKQNDFALLLLIILASISSLAAVEVARRRIKNRV